MKTKVLFCVSSHSGLYDTIMCSLYATRWCLFFAYMAFLCGFHTTCLWLTYIMCFVQDFLLSQLDLSLIYLSAVFHLRLSVIIWPVHFSQNAIGCICILSLTSKFLLSQQKTHPFKWIWSLTKLILCNLFIHFIIDKKKNQSGADILSCPNN